MDKIIEFKCSSNDGEEITKEFKNDVNVVFPNYHINSKDIAYMSKKLKEHKNDNICKVPFCTTVEAQAMGGLINLGDENNGPRISDYVFNNIEDMLNIKINLNEGRIKEVLNSIEILSNENELVCLNVEGPLTIIASLIDQKDFYKALRKNKELVNDIIKIIEDNIISYALEGIKSGAKIISYSDPVGAIDIVGPKVYKELSGPSSYNILKKLESKLGNEIIHLCGKTSTALEQINLSESEFIMYDENLTYGEAIHNELKDNNIKILGHSCMKRTPYKTKNPVLYNIKLK